MARREVLDGWEVGGRPQSTSRYFWPIVPPSPCHTLSHIPGPPKVRHTSQTPRFLVGLVQKIRTKTPCTSSLSIVRGGLSGVVCQRLFCLEGFVRGGFCPFLLLSQYICYKRKLNITLNFMFNKIMYDKKCISVTSHALDPNCHTYSDPFNPSSVTYFMDGPCVGVCVCDWPGDSVLRCFATPAHTIAMYTLQNREKENCENEKDSHDEEKKCEEYEEEKD